MRSFSLPKRLMLALLLCSGAVSARTEEQTFEFGFCFGAAMGLSESEDDEFKPHLRALLASNWSRYFQTELGVGYAQIGDGQYKTDLIPIDVRLRFRPLGSNSANPYLYTGFGALYYKVKTVPRRRAPHYKSSAWTGVIPLGVGVQYYFEEKISLDFSGGYNFSFSDALNPQNGGCDDSFFALLLGIRFAFGGENRY